MYTSVKLKRKNKLASRFLSPQEPQWIRLFND